MPFYPLLAEEQLYNGYIKAFVVETLPVLLVQYQGVVSVVENRCPHMGAPLDFGRVDNGNIRCPLHGMEFSLASGAGIGPSFCTGGLKVYQVMNVDGVVGISIS